MYYTNDQSSNAVNRKAPEFIFTKQQIGWEWWSVYFLPFIKNRKWRQSKNINQTEILIIQIHNKWKNCLEVLSHHWNRGTENTYSPPKYNFPLSSLPVWKKNPKQQNSKTKRFNTISPHSHHLPCALVYKFFWFPHPWTAMKQSSAGAEPFCKSSRRLSQCHMIQKAACLTLLSSHFTSGADKQF